MCRHIRFRLRGIWDEGLQGDDTGDEEDYLGKVMAKGEIRDIVDSLHPLEVRLLFAFGAFEAGKTIDDSLLISRASVEQAQKDMAIGWLLAKGVGEVTGGTVERIGALK